MHRHRPVLTRGLTLVETLVLCGVAVLLIGAILPAVAAVGCDDDNNSSIANLRRLAEAHAAYAADWGGRQFTLTADNLGEAGGSCANYTAQFGCHPPVILGETCDGNEWGFYFGCGSGSCANFPFAKPFQYTPANGMAGTYRLINAQGFASYVNGRFYDPTFYAPADAPAYEAASANFAEPCEFVPPVPPSNFPALSSYILSPAAMFDPKVLSKNPSTGKYWKNPDSFADGYKSPGVDQCTFPDLKTRMIEHNWLRKPPSPCNPDFAGPCQPWLFNHGFESLPNALFFDGSVRHLGPTKAQQDDQRVLFTTDTRLWSRDTPLGSNGYYQLQSHDFLTDTSYHMLTVDGILGRDTVTAEGR